MPRDPFYQDRIDHYIRRPICDVPAARGALDFLDYVPSLEITTSERTEILTQVLRLVLSRIEALSPTEDAPDQLV
jgi:hypothetical protein